MFMFSSNIKDKMDNLLMNGNDYMAMPVDGLGVISTTPAAVSMHDINKLT